MACVRGPAWERGCTPLHGTVTPSTAHTSVWSGGGGGVSLIAEGHRQPSAFCGGCHCPEVTLTPESGLQALMTGDVQEKS